MLLTKQQRLSPFSFFDRYFDSPGSINGVSSFDAPLSVSENEKEFSVSLELPGVEKKDISIEFKDEVLIISGEKENRIEKDDHNVHYTEISHGSFQRKVRLGNGVDFDEAKANFENGLLSVTIPKDTSKTSKRLLL